MDRAVRALVVEDDPSWQQLISEILTDQDVLVDLADHLPGAVELARATPHRIAVLDLSLGGVDHHNQDGLSVLDAIHRHDPSCVCIVLTGFATVELAVEVIQSRGGFTCLRKETFRRADFRKVVTQALQAAPTAPVPPDQPAVPFTPEPRPRQFTGKALVVEDDAGWRGLLVELVQEGGYQALQSSSYVEALGMLNHGSFQLAIIDLSLASSLQPGHNQDGYRLLTTTRRISLPTLIVSGYADPQDIERAYQEFGVYACLEKQAFDRRAFLETIQRMKQSESEDSHLLDLTAREKEVLALLGKGMTNKEIASILFITPNTVKRHLKSLFAKLGVQTRAAASAIATRSGMVGR